MPVPEEMPAAAETERPDGEPGLGLVVGIIAIPLVPILAGTFGSIWLAAGSTATGVASFIGTPAVALTVAALLAFRLLGYRRGMTKSRVAELSAASTTRACR
ncbi:GntT/GntP/DsdX family permease [Actinophytocola sp. KF-1]